jgi:hypothetical protein
MEESRGKTDWLLFDLSQGQIRSMIHYADHMVKQHRGNPYLFMVAHLVCNFRIFRLIGGKARKCVNVEIVTACAALIFPGTGASF